MIYRYIHVREYELSWNYLASNSLCFRFQNSTKRVDQIATVTDIMTIPQLFMEAPKLV